MRFLKAVESTWKAFGKLFGGSRERFGRLFGICVLWLGGRAVIELAQLALGFVSSVKECRKVCKAGSWSPLGGLTGGS